jgi:hypothetical protein
MDYLDSDLISLYDSLISVASKRPQFSGIVPQLFPLEFLFELHRMTKNNMIILLAESGESLSAEKADILLKSKLIHQVLSGEQEKYSLTLKGVASCIQLKYGLTLGHQFENFLELCDEKVMGIQNSSLNDKEKLASLCLLLVASGSIASEIRLDDEANQKVMSSVLTETLQCLKDFKVVNTLKELRIAKGEITVCGIMRRSNELTRKTNLLYLNDKDCPGYYFDIEKNGEPRSERITFLLKKIFDQYDYQCNSSKLFERLSNISGLYAPKFRGRKLNSNVLLGIIKEIKHYLENNCATSDLGN